MKIIHYHHTPVYIGGKWEDLSKFVNLMDYSKVILILDENVYRLWKDRFTNFQYLIVPSGEEQKSLMVVEQLIQQLIDLDADRSTLLIGVGGGVVCDITGFVGAVFMRGIAVGLVPTTLLAQVDAAIGGKNGVNTGDYKNMIGTIVQPTFILSDSSFLNTLPDVEFVNGMAEVIKHGCILDEDYFSFIESNVSQIAAKEEAILEYMIKRSVELKSEVVQQDERESGRRRLLNYGHTFGHAIEKKYGLPHGYAVSLGMVMVNRFMVKENKLSSEVALRIKKLLANFELPVDDEKYDFLQLVDLVLHDKKRKSDEIHLITINQVGSAEIVPVNISKLREYRNV
jgi:3-dehydroquinate synthase